MQLTMRLAAIAALLLAAPVHGARSRTASQVLANPIRKVVNMLQAMQKKVQEEGEKEEELFKKFMCYCKGQGLLKASIQSAEGHGPAVTSEIQEAEEKLAQAKVDLQQAQGDDDAAKDAMLEATELRRKEAKAYAGEKSEYDLSLATIYKAIAAIEKGMAGSFLQTSTAADLRKILMGKQEIVEADRQELLAFLEGKSEYAPKSGEIVGILKEMAESFEKSLKDATDTENAAIKTYEALMDAKGKERGALGATVEAKTKQIGDLGVQIVQMKDDLTDGAAALLEDKQLYADMLRSCNTKEAEWEERKKLRAEELLALAETIKVLNDDDALELFKKTLPATSASFVQVRASGRALRGKALTELRNAEKHAEAHTEDLAAIDLIALTLAGKKSLARGGFDKVIKMIDNMLSILKQEQNDDENKKEYCSKQFDLAADKQKSAERAVANAEQEIETAKEGIATLTDEIAALEKGIKDLDKSVTEATEQRKEENIDYKDLIASDAAAKELLNFAKNRLNKFYNPKIAEAAPEAPVLAEVAAVRRQLNHQVPAPPPETWGPYQKKEESSGVLQMISLLIKDLEKEMTEAEAEEKGAQAAYEKMMEDSAKKRVADSKSLGSKASAKADLEGDLYNSEQAKTTSGKELMATLKYTSSLHAECDWLLQYFDVRKEARAGEADALKKAKAILSGADYSFLQTRAR